ncbi:MAG: hypothetical protein ACKPKO_01175 [Candidatus Fonsibacter sp.]
MNFSETIQNKQISYKHMFIVIANFFIMHISPTCNTPTCNEFIRLKYDQHP